ncbi:alpha/beta hydrolase [Deinococcus sonorensis]|uniref:Alpha/beta hydrolase n=2 Tax=Deinococcus sonorensis TaxID=309891 RepID=A0AAU7U606_9DEIO
MTHDSFVTPGRPHHLQLSDGRRFAWCEWGPPDGLPAVFCTGAAMSGTLGFGVLQLMDVGVRLIAPDRPGLGRSDAHPGKTLLSWTQDVRQLLDHLGQQTAVGVGFSQGAPFALALAATGVTLATAVVSGQDELAHPRVRPHVHPDVNSMLNAIDADAERFEQHFAGFATADGLWDLILGMSGPEDRAFYRQPAFDHAYRRALQEGFSQGASGYARDLVNALRPWPFAVEQITTSVDLWYGARDTSTVHAPDFGRTLASRLPNATLHLLEHEGGALLWTRAAEILRTLCARAAAVPTRT